MTDRVRPRERETEAAGDQTRFYEPQDLAYGLKEIERAAHGRIVIRARERMWDLGRQAKTKHFLSPLESELEDTATQYWEVFMQVMPQRSGRHRHQGGLVIFVLEGKGHSIVENVRHDWEAGDLMLLSLRPGGVEHQHFNDDPDRPAQWVALKYFPYFDYCGSEMTQLDNSPLYDQWVAKMNERGRDFAEPDKPARRHGGRKRP